METLKKKSSQKKLKKTCAKVICMTMVSQYSEETIYCAVLSDGTVWSVSNRKERSHPLTGMTIEESTVWTRKPEMEQPNVKETI